MYKNLYINCYTLAIPLTHVSEPKSQLRRTARKNTSPALYPTQDNR